MKFFLEQYDGVLLILGAGGITILVKTIVACIYTELLRQAQQISTTKNKWMRNMVCKYETTYKMNLKISDTKSYIFMQMKDVKYLGINLYNIRNTGTYGLAVTGIIYAVYMIWGYYGKNGTNYYVSLSIAVIMVSFAICISELFLQLNRKDKLLKQELYDYIENNLKPHLYKSMLQSAKAADNKNQGDVTQEAAVVKETVSVNNKENCEDGKESENLYGDEELELFQEMMEGIYGEEI